MNSLSLIIPTYNQETVIEKSLKEYYKFFSRNFKDFEIIVVCNACKDETYERVNRLRENFPLVVLNTSEKGKGNAVAMGFKQAKYEIVGFLDADNPYDLKEVLKMLNYLDSFDMVIVTKFRRALKYQTSLTRRFFSIAGAVVFRLLFGQSFKDTQAGAKFMRRDLLKKFKKKFMCTGFEFDMELLYEASKLNSRIKEYYIAPNGSDFSTVKMRILPGIVYRLIKMRVLK